MDLTDLSLLILQVGVGLTFAAHGAQKLFGWWDGPGMAGWQAAIQHMGFRPARLFAPLAALLELGGGLLLAAGLLTPLVAAALVAQAIVIIGSVHWSNGFFSAHSGFEFPLLLGLGAAAVGLAGAGPFSADALIGLDVEPVVRVALILGGTVGGLVTMLLPRFGAAEAQVRPRQPSKP